VNESAVPTVPVVEEALAKAGTWSTSRANDWLVPPTVLLALIDKGQEPAVPAAGVPEIVAVPLPLSVKLTPVGRAPVSASVGVAEPVVVTENEPETPTVKAVEAALVMAEGWPMDRSRSWVALPATLTAVRATVLSPISEAVGVPEMVAVPLPLSVKEKPAGSPLVAPMDGTG
jgi:hypothetical protein